MIDAKATGTKALVAIGAELLDRLEVGISGERDECALVTALTKALVAGSRIGAVQTIDQLEREYPDVSVTLTLASEDDVDDWAERYGEQTSES